MDAWQKWLENNDSYENLLIIADKIYNKFYKSKKQAYLEKFCDVSSLDESEMREAIVGRLWDFLAGLEEETAVGLADQINKGDWSIFRTNIEQKCISHVRDQLRDPYYRHVRDVLYKERKNIYYKSEPGFTFYAYTTNKCLPLIAELKLSKISYRTWPKTDLPPKEDGSLFTIHHKQGILKIAEFFWNQTVEYFGKEYVLPIRELVRYIKAAYGQRGEIPEVEFQTEGSDSIPTIDDKGICEYESMLSLPLSLACITQVAGKLLNNLSGWEKKLFCLSTYGGVSRKECARLFELNGASGAQYHLKKIIAKLQPDSENELIVPDEATKKSFNNILADFCKKII